MTAFSGKYYYRLDEKGRLIIPAPLREIISLRYGPKLYITNALFDKCLHLYPEEEWAKLQEKVRVLPGLLEEIKLYKRRVIASAQSCVMDKQGRVLVPSALREDAGINGDIVIVGQIEKIELWDRKEWESAIDITKLDRKAVEEKLASFGL